jgi:N6-adenosine-specific RNA methylase IME4
VTAPILTVAGLDAADSSKMLARDRVRAPVQIDGRQWVVVGASGPIAVREWVLASVVARTTWTESGGQCFSGDEVAAQLDAGAREEGDRKGWLVAHRATPLVFDGGSMVLRNGPDGIEPVGDATLVGRSKCLEKHPETGGECEYDHTPHPEGNHRTAGRNPLHRADSPAGQLLCWNTEKGWYQATDGKEREIGTGRDLSYEAAVAEREGASTSAPKKEPASKKARGTCPECKQLVVQRSSGECAKHKDPEGAECLGIGQLTVEWADLKRRRKADRERPLPDLPYDRALACGLCGYLAWEPEAHNMIASTLCPGSPGGVPLDAKEPLGPNGRFERDGGRWIASMQETSHGRSHLRDMQVRLADSWTPDVADTLGLSFAEVLGHALRAERPEAWDGVINARIGRAALSTLAEVAPIAAGSRWASNIEGMIEAVARANPGLLKPQAEPSPETPPAPDPRRPSLATHYAEGPFAPTLCGDDAPLFSDDPDCVTCKACRAALASRADPVPATEVATAPTVAERLRIALIGCGKKKREVPCPARELYTGNLFRAARRDAESRGLPWFVVSAKHAFVDPDRVLEPYEYELKPEEALNWGGDVADGLLVYLRTLPGILGDGSRGGTRWIADVPGLVVELHLGERYAAPIRAAFAKHFPAVRIEEPCAGLEIGERLQLYAARSHVETFPTAEDVAVYIAKRDARAADGAGPESARLAEARRQAVANGHEYANLFPMMSDGELVALAEDIRTNGQRDAIVVHEVKLLDGRNRYAACLLAGVEPHMAWFEGDDPLGWVLSKNLHRRDLTASQRAMIAAELPGLREAAARRQEASRVRAGEQVGAVEREPSAPARKASEDAAAVMGVGSRLVEHANKVKRDGVPELAEAVKRGDLEATTASDIARAPAEEQKSIVELLKPREGESEDQRREREKAVKKAAKDIAARDKAVRDRKKHEARVEQLKKAGAAAPDLQGVEIKHCKVAELLATLPDGVVALTHADPPWSYDRQVGNGTTDRHYDTSMLIEDIVADLVEAYRVAADDSYLLLWCTGPILPEWFEAARGKLPWRYVSKGSWHKTDGVGTGIHWRGDSEDLLLYAKGNPKPLETVSNSWASPRQDHSEKPEEWLRKLLVAFCPEGGLVADFYAGRAPACRAAAVTGRRCIAAESDEQRFREAVQLLNPTAPLFAAAGK